MKQNRIIDAVLYHDLIQFFKLNDVFKVFELFDLQPFLRVKKVQDVSVLRQLVPRSFDTLASLNNSLKSKNSQISEKKQALMQTSNLLSGFV